MHQPSKNVRLTDEDLRGYFNAMVLFRTVLEEYGEGDYKEHRIALMDVHASSFVQFVKRRVPSGWTFISREKLSDLYKEHDVQLKSQYERAEALLEEEPWWNK